MIQGVIFDLHGTLVRGRESTGEKESKDEALSTILREAGHEVYFQELRAARHYVAFVDYVLGRANTPFEFYAKLLERLEIPHDFRLVSRLAKKAAEMEEVELYPDAVPTIETVKEMNIKTAVLTTIAIWRFQSVLDANGVKMDYIYTGREAGAVKPNPRAYLTVLEKLSLKPSEALMVGDDLATDVLAPKRLGMRGVWLRRNGKEESSKADYIVSSLTELPGIVNMLNP